MAKKFRYDFSRRVVDRFLTWLIGLGRGPASFYLLTVPGRKTGRLYTKPVALVEEGQDRWLVAPYGVVDWVKNAQAAGEVTLSRGNRTEILSIRRLSPGKSAPILKQYLNQYPITAPYFNAQPDSPVEIFESEAVSRPVYALLPKRGEL